VWKRLVVVVVIALALAVAIVWKACGHRTAHSATGRAAKEGTVAREHAARAPLVPASLAGKVTRKSDGSAVAGATIAIARVDIAAGMGGRSEMAPIVVTTDASGAWLAPKVPPADYIVTASAPTFLPARHARIGVAPGEAKTGIDLALEPGGTLVSGLVSDVGGGPIAGARVIALEESLQAITGQTGVYITVSGDDGRYQLSLPDGTFELSAHHDDYAQAKHDTEVAGKPVTVDFVLVPGGGIRGQVIARDTGKPVPTAFVQAHAVHGDDDAADGMVADAEGKFVLHSLPPGSIAIEAAGPGYVSMQPTVVDLAIGEQVDGVRVLVDHALSISGRVVEKASQQGIAGVQVSAWAMANGQHASAAGPTEADGAFEIVGVRPGSYILFAMADEKMPEIGKPIEVSDKDVTGVLIEVATGSTLSGRVDPASRATVGLSLVGDIGIANFMEAIKALFVQTETDDTGAFVLKHAPAGKFVLVARTREGPAGKLAVTISDGDQSGLVIALEKRAAISGRVVDTAGAPVAGMHVRAQRTDKEASEIVMEGVNHDGATSGADGAFKIVGLDAGKYRVEPQSSADREPSKKTPEAIDLAAGTERTGVIVTVEAKNGVIRGTVLASDGKAIPDSWVTAYLLPAESSQDKVVDDDSLDSSQPVLTKDDGRFVITRLRAGTYRVVADGPRGASRGEKESVKPGDSITITLASLGTLSGHVTQGAGAVLSYDLHCHGPSGEVDRHFAAADGAYSLDRLAPGAYACTASADAGNGSGQVSVPAGAATLDIALAPWATLSGTVVSVLDGRPVPDVVAVTEDTTEMANILTGGGPVTDATGRFTVNRVAPGNGSVMLFPKSSITTPAATVSYQAVAGQNTDLGTIKIAPPRTGDPGTLGMATELEDADLSVTMVQAGGPAASAGIVVGDKITAIQGTPVTTLTPKVAQQLISSGAIAAGQTMSLALARGTTVSVTAAKW
jgi:hypothetical protein